MWFLKRVKAGIWLKSQRSEKSFLSKRQEQSFSFSPFPFSSSLPPFPSPSLPPSLPPLSLLPSFLLFIFLPSLFLFPSLLFLPSFLFFSFSLQLSLPLYFSSISSLSSCWKLVRDPSPALVLGRGRGVGEHAEANRGLSLFRVPRDNAQLAEIQNSRCHIGGRYKCFWHATRWSPASGWASGQVWVSGVNMFEVSLWEC